MTRSAVFACLLSLATPLAFAADKAGPPGQTGTAPGLAGTTPGQSGTAPGKQKQDTRALMDQIDDWSDTSKKAAKAMLDKYGQPDETTDSMWIWHDNGPWKRTIVYGEAVDHRFPMPHKDVLEQFVDYDAPVDKFDELAAFDGSVIVERTKAEMSARCDKEAANFLAINLANDVATGKRSVEEARRFYADTIKGMMQGESSPYLQGFVFEVAQEDLNNPDEPVIQTAQN